MESLELKVTFSNPHQRFPSILHSRLFFFFASVCVWKKLALNDRDRRDWPEQGCNKGREKQVAVAGTLKCQSHCGND